MAPSWVVHKYIPEKLYGFVADLETGHEVFFHLGAFRSGILSVPGSIFPCRRHLCSWPDAAPPPILGEPVTLLLPSDQIPGQGRAPKALQVNRLTSPSPLTGTVETFDAGRGFGFIQGTDGTGYHLHRSEVLDGRIPVVGQTGVFFSGLRQGRPRACHVRLCPHMAL